MRHESVGPKVVDDGRPEDVVVAFFEGEAVGGDAGNVGEPVGDGAVCVGADEVLRSRRAVGGARVGFSGFTRVGRWGSVMHGTLGMGNLVGHYIQSILSTQDWNRDKV